MKHKETTNQKCYRWSLTGFCITTLLIIILCSDEKVIAVVFSFLLGFFVGIICFNWFVNWIYRDKI